MVILPLGGLTREPIRARVSPAPVDDPACVANKRFHFLVLAMIEIGDTGSAPYDEGIKGARGAHVEGRAVAQASTALVKLYVPRLQHIGARILEMSHGLGEGRFLIKANQSCL
jgi:hypothetical protein